MLADVSIAARDDEAVLDEPSSARCWRNSPPAAIEERF